MTTKGRQAKPYSLSWAEQDALFRLLPRHLADAALFAMNTGCREKEICQLRWEWKVEIPALGTSVFILPESITKTGTERIMVLNSVASRVIGSRRALHATHVFSRQAGRQAAQQCMAQGLEEGRKYQSKPVS